MTRPSDIIVIAENQAFPYPDIHVGWLWRSDPAGNPLCPGVFAHSAGKMANFIFYDGHVKSKKWLATLYPITENNWEIHDHPDPNNLNITGENGCNRKMPPGPDAAPARGDGGRKAAFTAVKAGENPGASLVGGPRTGRDDRDHGSHGLTTGRANGRHRRGERDDEGGATGQQGKRPYAPRRKH